MPNSCRLFSTEYSLNYINRGHVLTEKFEPRDHFAERIREGEIDPRIASIPTELDEAAEQLIHKHNLDKARTVYQVNYKNPWAPRDDERAKAAKEKGFENELLTYIENVYFDPHEEKVLAPPVTTKRRATIMIQEHEKKKSRPANVEATVKKSDPCASQNGTK